MLMKSKVFIIFVLLAILGYPRISKADETANWFVSGTSASIFLGSELLKEQLAPKTPHFTTPNSLDANLRLKLKWSNSDLEFASHISDAMLYGVFVPSIYIVPFFLRGDYDVNTELIVRSCSITSLFIQLGKFSAGRERPYSYYGTLDSEGVDDNLSFMSGHSAFAFAIATSSAYLLSAEYPKHKKTIWTTALTLAAFTAYLRIASDKHYFSDIVAGSFIGATVGYLTASEIW